MYPKDIIAAIATPPGAGGVGIIRVSGENVLPTVKDIFHSKAGVKDYKPATMYYGDFCGEKNIDSGYFVWFKAPYSFTGEDIVELHCHGGMIILHTLLQFLYTLGVRPAEAGEFSKRAFLNGRMDLVQAEAIADLISAGSKKAAELARTQYSGRLSEKIAGIREDIAGVLAWMEAEIDYPDADLESIELNTYQDSLLKIHNEISTLGKTYNQGKIYRDGISTVLVGRPNVGKSSLLNKLAGEDRAIVTDIPGTTRDILEIPVNIRGIPLRLMDTAGIRESSDTVEKIGIDRARRTAAGADLALVVLDISRELDSQDLALLETINRDNAIVVVNKVDLGEFLEEQTIRELGFKEVIRVSVAENIGLEDLAEAIERRFISGEIKPDSTFITNQRHHQALVAAADIISVVLEGWETYPLDILAMDLREAWFRLGEITGGSWTDDLLDCIFQRFCLGK